MRRARPLLGTIVDIQAQGRGVTAARALEAGFKAIARVHQLMSFHEDDSDVSRLNREAVRNPVKVHPWTWRVLKAARQFSRQSAGVFDITVARSLAAWGLLPPVERDTDAGATWEDIVLLNSGRVRFRRGLAIDLGGIGKGFAVDCAVSAMRRAGATTGMVNAGGDIRVFGEAFQAVRLRHPADPLDFAGTIRLRGAAMATTANYFGPDKTTGVGVGHLIDGRTRRRLPGSLSVTVTSPTCLVADALTKIVFALAEKAAPILDAYRAGALLIERSGEARWISQAHVG
jgi:FAD:protein FMN transferase